MIILGHLSTPTLILFVVRSHWPGLLLIDIHPIFRDQIIPGRTYAPGQVAIMALNDVVRELQPHEPPTPEAAKSAPLTPHGLLLAYLREDARSTIPAGSGRRIHRPRLLLRNVLHDVAKIRGDTVLRTVKSVIVAVTN
jgi:hypothetical protein